MWARLCVMLIAVGLIYLASYAMSVDPLALMAISAFVMIIDHKFRQIVSMRIVEEMMRNDDRSSID